MVYPISVLILAFKKTVVVSCYIIHLFMFAQSNLKQEIQFLEFIHD